ncbi:2-nitropropane dioxygenase [Daedaleopsis nitida]|nr:2-nitropropane dioxygenase [Daedaleopsis nitida]
MQAVKTSLTRLLARIPPAKLREDLALARKSFPELGDRPLPIGVGFIAWMLDADEQAAKQLVDVALESNVQAIWLAFGNDVHRWIQYARNSSAHASFTDRPLVFVQVTSVEEALLAANEWKADVIVAQGNESGGHGGASTPSTAPPVLAAGGMANGTQVAAYLTLGAAGAVLGTRFLLTPESPYSDAQKAALLAAKSGSTTRTLALDYARGTYDWPAGIDGRGIRNRICDDIDAGVPHETVRELLTKGTQEGDAAYMVVWSGQGVSLMEEIKPVKDVMAELHTEVVRQLQRSQQLLQA